MFCFFFSSRRRHTRCSRDWSSDVCSSDLPVRAKDDSEISECEECGKFEEGLGGFGLIRAGDDQGHKQGGEYSEDRAKRPRLAARSTPPGAAATPPTRLPAQSEISPHAKPRQDAHQSLDLHARVKLWIPENANAAALRG